MSGMCSVCDKEAAEAGALECGHQYCHDCFGRYEQGSLEELDHCIRCCICGSRTLLTMETKGEIIVQRFGRDHVPKLREPVGLARLAGGSYVTADPTSRRVYVFDQAGKHLDDFAYVHNTTPQTGIAVTRDNHIAIPFTDGTNSYVSYFTPGGAYLSSTYLPPQCRVRSVTVSPENEILVTDSVSRSVHVINKDRILAKSVQLEQRQEEKREPEPWGVAVTSRGETIVSDVANDTIRVYDKQWKLFTTFGGRGMRPGQFHHPCGLAVDEYDRLLVADRDNHRVQLFTEDFHYRRYVVRYNRGRTVYVAPSDVECVTGGYVAILLTGNGDARAAEVRLYTTAGPQM